MHDRTTRTFQNMLMTVFLFGPSWFDPLQLLGSEIEATVNSWGTLIFKNSSTQVRQKVIAACLLGIQQALHLLVS